MQNNNADMIKKRKLNSITGLKVICLFGIFIWHCGLISAPDLGARCCEAFFVISGFLGAYQHHHNYKYTIDETINTAKRKLLAVYPLHLVTFLLAALLLLPNIKTWFDIKYNVVSAIINLLLLQSWFSKMIFSYNGVSWFLSSLLFCYTFTPFLSKVILKAKRYSRGPEILFLLIFIIRILSEIFTIMFPDLFQYSVHTNPIVRLLEYFLAYIAGCIFVEKCIQNSKKEENSFLLYSTLEFVVFIVIYVIVIQYDKIWLRGYYIPFFITMVFIIAIGKGVLSKILSLRIFQILGSIELEFFIFHQVVINYIRIFTSNSTELFLFALISTTIISSFWITIKNKIS